MSDFLERQIDIVQSLEKAFFLERVDLEIKNFAVGRIDLLVLQIDYDSRVGSFVCMRHELVYIGLRKRDRQDAVLEAIIVENVREACRNHAFDPEVLERPRSVLSGRPASEVVSRHDDLRFPPRRLVQDEIGFFFSFKIVAHLEKQADPQACALDGFQELLRDDHVGIDVHQRHRCCDTSEFFELFHGVAPIPSALHPSAAL